MPRSIFSQRSDEKRLQTDRNADELFTRIFWDPFRHETPPRVPLCPGAKRTKGRPYTGPAKLNTCQVCKKQFRWPKDLEYHHAYYHSGKKLNVCPEPTCDRYFQFPYQLAIHRRMAEHHDWRVSCKVCGKRFGATSHLSRHTAASCKKFKSDMALKKVSQIRARED